MKDTPPSTRLGRAPLVFLALATVVCLLGFSLQPVLTGNQMSAQEIEQLVPTQVGEWQQIETGAKLVSVENPNEVNFDQPYDAQVMRAYANPNGDVIMLALAYGQNQRQDIKIHRPEVCYPATGWQVLHMEPHQFPLKNSTGEMVSGKRMLTLNPRANRRETVSYWIRIGDTFSSSGWTQRWHILKQGLQGERTDGILVRFSQVIPAGASEEAAYQLQDKFATAMYEAMPPAGRRLLTH